MTNNKALNGVILPTFSSILLAPEPCTKITAGTGYVKESGKVKMPFNGYFVFSPTIIFSTVIF